MPPWKRPERWLAFVLTFLCVCSFLAIVPVADIATPAEDGLAGAQRGGALQFIDYLREGASEVQVVGHWTSLLPPLVAVMVAAFFRSMVGALLSAFVVGSCLSYGLNPLATAVLGANDFLLAPSLSLFGALVVLFLFSLVGMVRVMEASGGLSGLVAQIGRVAKGRRRAKLTIGLGGALIFFDDISNTVVLGTTMQRLADRWRISREKLAYLVDTTAAPVAGLALLSTWVAFETSLLSEVSASQGVEVSGYGLLAQMLPLRFYCIGALVFLFLSSGMGRDFGPMLAAERRAFFGDGAPCGQEVDTSEGGRWYNAVVPIGVVLLCIVGGILFMGAMRLRSSGYDFSWASLESWQSAFGAAVLDPERQSKVGVMPALLAASAVGGLVAMLLPVAQRALTLRRAVAAYTRGLPSIWRAIFILVMTWSMQAICQNLGTAQYLTAMLGDAMPLWLLPMMAFLLAGGMSFATGSSWGSMGILIPILMPLAARLGALDEGNFVIYLLTAAAILDGAIFGDHCSPISNTTVLSSLSTGCDHIAHVNTQLYYAVFTVALSCVFGYAAVGGGLPLWVFYLGFPLASFGLLRWLGRRSEEPAAA